MPTKTPEQKAEQAAAERERSARRKAANDRLAKLPQASRDAVRRDAQRRETAHEGPRVTAVTFLEQALDAFLMDGARTAASDVRTAMAGHRTKAAKRPGTDAGDDPPKTAKRPKGPREKSTPKEAGSPEPEHKTGAIDRRRRGTPSADIVPTADELAANAKAARGGDAALQVVVSVEVPDGTAYCKTCDTTKAESEFWPLKRTDKSKRRAKCRDCFNAEWAEWDRKRREAATATA